MQADLAAGSKAPWPKEQIPEYPFLTLLVSGKHTMLVHTTSAVDHRILASADTIALGDVLDKFAREVVPESEIPAGTKTVVYPKLMEDFVGPERREAYAAPTTRAHETSLYRSPHGWEIRPPMLESRAMAYNFTDFHGRAQQILRDRPHLADAERRDLAFDVMRIAFEHVMSRVLLALARDEQLRPPHPRPRQLVLSGGVTANLLLRRIAQATLRARGFPDVHVVAPDPRWCTDNAAMIAYAGAVMYRDGWASSGDALCPRSKWPIEGLVGDRGCYARRAGFDVSGQVDVEAARRDAGASSASAEPGGMETSNGAA